MQASRNAREAGVAVDAVSPSPLAGQPVYGLKGAGFG
jgi:hypothetical protein